MGGRRNGGSREKQKRGNAERAGDTRRSEKGTEDNQQEGKRQRGQEETDRKNRGHRGRRMDRPRVRPKRGQRQTQRKQRGAGREGHGDSGSRDARVETPDSSVPSPGASSPPQPPQTTAGLLGQHLYPPPPEEVSATSPSCGKAPGVSTQWEPGVGTSEGTWAHALARPAPQVLGETPSSRPRFPPSHRLQLCDSHSHLQLTPRANPALRPPGVHTLGKGKPSRYQRPHLTLRAAARGPRFAPGRKLFSSGAGGGTVPAPELKTREDPTGHPVEMDPIRQGGQPPGTGGQVPDTRPGQSTRTGRTGKEGSCGAEGRSGSETLTQPERRADEARTSVLHTLHGFT